MAGNREPSTSVSRAVLVAGVVIAAALGIVLLLPSGPFGGFPSRAPSTPSGQVPVLDPNQGACSGFDPALGTSAGREPAVGQPPAVVATVPVGSDPAFPVYDPASGLVYVTNSGSGNVSVLDGTALVGSVLVGETPVGAAYDAANGYVYVANEASCTVSVISGTTVIANLSVGSAPSWVAYDSENQIVYVTNSGSGSVSAIQGLSVLGNVTVGASPDTVTADPISGVAYVTNGVSDNVSLLSGTASIGSVSVGSDPDFVAYDSANGNVYVTNDGSNNVSVIQGTALAATIPVGNAPDSATVDTANGWVYVANYLSDNVTLLNGTAIVTSTSVGGGPTYGMYDSASGEVLLANYRSNTTSVLSGAAVIATLPVGLGPHILAFDSGNGFVYVTDSLSASVTVLGPTYPVTFEESGLASATVWSVTLGASTFTSTGSSLSFAELPGTYAYSAIPPAGYRLVSASPASPITVVGSAVVVDLAFAPISNETFTVTFTSSGFMCGDHLTWGVSLANSSQSSSNTSIVFEEPNGTYNYTILAPAGYEVLSASPSSPVTLEGTNLIVTVTFQKVQILTITVKEHGLASGTTWCVTVGLTECSSGRSIQFVNVTSGNYSFSISPVTGYIASPASGSVIVTTQSVTVLVSFQSTGSGGGGGGGCMGPAATGVGPSVARIVDL